MVGLNVGTVSSRTRQNRSYPFLDLTQTEESLACISGLGVWGAIQTVQKRIRGSVEFQDPVQTDLQNYSPDGRHQTA
jgi:hypothetical protein